MVNLGFSPKSDWLQIPESSRDTPALRLPRGPGLSAVPSVNSASPSGFSTLISWPLRPFTTSAVLTSPSRSQGTSLPHGHIPPATHPCRHCLFLPPWRPLIPERPMITSLDTIFTSFSPLAPRHVPLVLPVTRWPSFESLC